MDSAALTVLIILVATVILFVFEFIRIDLTAILCMLALGWTGVLTPMEAFSGFSSNAVIAMMGVMILGQGIAKTGIMDRFSRAVLKKAGMSRRRLIALMSLSVGILSGFMQNIGAAALFLPGILNISRREKIPASTLIMPIGFAAILGGSLSMVGSSPLILINDLLRNADLAPYGLLSVTPVGILLLFSGIGFFFLVGQFVLPGSKSSEVPLSEQEKLVAALKLPNHISHFIVPENSPLIGMTNEQSGVWGEFHLHIVGIGQGREMAYAPWRETRFKSGQVLTLLGSEDEAKRFASVFSLTEQNRTTRAAGFSDPLTSGFAEVIVPPRSALVGQTMRQFSLRRRFAVEPVLMFSKGEKIWGDFSDHPILPGDTIIVHGLWEKINELTIGSDFVVATPYSVIREVHSSSWIALLCFLVAIALPALTAAPISMSFFGGAVAMVLTRVLTIQEIYQAIEWKVVFLIAGLIPLGLAMQKTGSATLLAEAVMSLFAGSHPAVLVLIIALLATVFSLFITNVGAIVVMAPLVMSMAQISGLDPRPLVLLAAVCSANSFILPTHQVNALLMSAGGYRNRDYIRAGGGMSLLFLVVAVAIFYIFYL